MKKLLVILSLMLSTNASAGILLEPYVGYATGTSEQAGTESDESGMGFGARLGWTMPLVFVALDYSTASMTQDPPTGADQDYDATNLGLVVGASLPVLRLWAGYNFQSDVEFDDGSEGEGSGMKFGLGYKLPVLPISFNLEYIMTTIDESAGVALGANEIDAKTIFLSVSAPFVF